MIPKTPSNVDIADALDRIADLLEVQDANKFRVGAYRYAAWQIRTQNKEMATLVFSKDDSQLEEVSGVGKGIAAIIREFVRFGRIGLLDRLEGEMTPEYLFRSLPTIGDKLAQRIYHHLDIETLEELEIAALTGELQKVPGIGPRRAGAIRNSVEALLNRSGRRQGLWHRKFHKGEKLSALSETNTAPSVALLLAVDEEYRRKAAAGRLKTIAPRRFNPDRIPWLPIFHTEKKGWYFTGMFSNTARAHELEKTKDWVVIYFNKDDIEDRCTIVTEFGGALKGRRVVRGRENECRQYYNNHGVSSK